MGEILTIPKPLLSNDLFHVDVSEIETYSEDDSSCFMMNVKFPIKMKRETLESMKDLEQFLKLQTAISLDTISKQISKIIEEENKNEKTN